MRLLRQGSQRGGTPGQLDGAAELALGLRSLGEALEEGRRPRFTLLACVVHPLVLEARQELSFAELERLFESSEPFEAVGFGGVDPDALR